MVNSKLCIDAVQAALLWECVENNKDRIRRDFTVLAVIQLAAILMGAGFLFGMLAIAAAGDVSSWKAIAADTVCAAVLGLAVYCLKRLFSWCRSEKIRIQEELDVLNRDLAFLQGFFTE